MTHADKPIDHHSLAQAAEWYATLQADDASEHDRQAWQRWLGQHPRHQYAWSCIEAASARFAFSDDAAQRSAAAAALKAGVTATNGRRKALLQLCGATACTGLLGWLVWQHEATRNTAIVMAAGYRTSTGDIRDFVLPDGTRLWLNTASAVNFDDLPAVRRLQLLAGDIVIDTAADPVRPFIVSTQFGELQALGTRFSIRLMPDHILMAVEEGAVAITTKNSRQQMVVNAGFQARFDNSQIHAATPLPPQHDAWTQGIFIARNITLTQWAAEISRYRHTRIDVDPAIANLRVMGSYPLRDTDQALALLSQALPVRVQSRLPWRTSIVPHQAQVTRNTEP